MKVLLDTHVFLWAAMDATGSLIGARDLIGDFGERALPERGERV